MNAQPKLRVAVLAADIISASALYALLAEHDSLEPVATLDASAADSLAVYKADVLLSDLGWSPDIGGVQDARTALPEQGLIEGVPVVALVTDSYQAAAAWRAGYRSLLLRSESPRALVSAIHAVAEGLLTLSPQLATSLPFAGSGKPLVKFEELTKRELEVLDLVAEGLTNKGIAHRLSISEHTVKFHVNSILNKLAADSRTDAVVRATRAGLILL